MESNIVESDQFVTLPKCKIEYDAERDRFFVQHEGKKYRGYLCGALKPYKEKLASMCSTPFKEVRAIFKKTIMDSVLPPKSFESFILLELHQ